MKWFGNIFVVILLVWGLHSFGQTQVCDSIYLASTDLVSYQNDVQDLSTYYANEFVPLIQEVYLPDNS